MSQCIIRYMTSADLSAVAAIEEATFSQPWSESGFEDAIKRDDTLFLVAIEDGEVCGYIGAYISFGEAEITNVCTATEYRGRGVGTALVKSFFADALERDVEKILLEVRISNEPAIALYKNQGFETIGVRPRFYSFPTEDALLMEKNIC